MAELEQQDSGEGLLTLPTSSFREEMPTVKSPIPDGLLQVDKVDLMKMAFNLLKRLSSTPWLPDHFPPLQALLQCILIGSLPFSMFQTTASF